MEKDVENDLTHDDDGVPEPESVAIGNILASMGSASDAMVTIMREGPGGYRDNEYLTECAPSEFSMARLQHEFGGGKFRIHIRENGRLVANRSVKVAGMKADVIGVAPQVHGEIRELAELVKDLAKMVATNTIVQNPAKSSMEILGEMKLMKEIMGGGDRQNESVSDPFESVMKAFDLAKTINQMSGGGGVEKPDATSLLFKAIESFGPALAQAAAMKSVQQVIPVVPAVSQQNQVQVLQESLEEQKPQQRDFEMLKMYLGFLKVKAEQKSDPGIYADVIIDNLDDDQIGELLSPPDWWERLCSIDSSLVQFGEWFAELRKVTLESLTEMAGEDTTGEKLIDTVKQNATSGNPKARNKGDS